MVKKKVKKPRRKTKRLVKPRRFYALKPKKKSAPKPKEKAVFKAEKTVSQPLSVAVPEEIHKTKIRVIGIGGGGSSIVSEIASRIKKASFVIANTDCQALKKASKGVKIFSFGQQLTHGLGTGMNSELGRIAAHNEKEKLAKLLEGQDICILVACLGGGAGSGAAPVFAKISRDLGNITYGIFTLPFKFEGERKLEIAREALEKLKSYLNALTVIPNEAIFEIVDKTTPLNTALSLINRNLAESLEGLIEIIYDPGLINIDFADLRTIFEGRGRITYLNTVAASGPNRAEEAVKKLLSNPLYLYTCRGAKGVVFNIVGRTLRLEEVSQISKTIAGLVNPEAKIIFGISQAGKDPEQIKITLLAPGCGAKILGPRAKELPEKIKKEGRGEQKPEELKVTRQEKVSLKKRIVRPKSKTRLVKRRKKAISSPKPLSKKEPPILVRAVKLIRRKKKATTGTKPKNSGKIGVEEIKKESLPTGAIPPAIPARLAAFSPNEAPQTEPKVRRNALQVKKAVEELEQEMINQEKQWEVPAFLRRKLTHNKGMS